MGSNWLKRDQSLQCAMIGDFSLMVNSIAISKPQILPTLGVEHAPFIFSLRAPRPWFRTLSSAPPSLNPPGPERYPPFSHRLPTPRELQPLPSLRPGAWFGAPSGPLSAPRGFRASCQARDLSLNRTSGSGVSSFLPLASCSYIPVARTIAPTHLQLQSPQNYARAGAFHFLFDVSLCYLSFKPCVTSYGAELRKIETISAFVPLRKSTVPICTFKTCNCFSPFSLCLKLFIPCYAVELRIRNICTNA